MAGFTPLPVVGFGVAAPDNTVGFTTKLGVGIGNGEAPFVNTREIVFLNRSTTNELLIRMLSSPVTTIPSTELTVDNSTLVPAGGAITFLIGTGDSRIDFDGNSEHGIFLAGVGAAVDVNVSYVQASGTPVGR